MSDATKARLLLAGLLITTSLTVLGLAFCRQLYALASFERPHFDAVLDVMAMTGMPPVAALYLFDAVLRYLPGQPRDDEPGTPTILYRLYGADEALLYVGITRNMERRMTQHSRKPWWPEVVTKDACAYRTRTAAAQAEHAAIMTEGPRHNRARYSLTAHLRSQGAR